MAFLPKRFFRLKKKRKEEKPNTFQRFFQSFITLFTCGVLGRKNNTKKNVRKPRGPERMNRMRFIRDIYSSSDISYTDSILSSDYFDSSDTYSDTDSDDESYHRLGSAMFKKVYARKNFKDDCLNIEEDAMEKVLTHWVNYDVFEDETERKQYEIMYGLFPIPLRDWSDAIPVTRYCTWAYTPQENMDVFNELPFCYSLLSAVIDDSDTDVGCRGCNFDERDDDFELKNLFKDEQLNSNSTPVMSPDLNTERKEFHELKDTQPNIDEADINEIIEDIFSLFNSDSTKYSSQIEKDDEGFDEKKNIKIKSMDNFEKEFDDEDFLALEEEILMENKYKEDIVLKDEQISQIGDFQAQSEVRMLKESDIIVSKEMEMLEEEIFQNFYQNNGQKNIFSKTDNLEFNESSDDVITNLQCILGDSKDLKE